MHFGNAYTNPDTVVYFPNLKAVVDRGSVLRPRPTPDFAAGGSLVNWGPVLAQILKLDFDVVMPGHRPGRHPRRSGSIQDQDRYHGVPRYRFGEARRAKESVDGPAEN